MEFVLKIALKNMQFCKIDTLTITLSILEESLLTVILLVICTCTYVRYIVPSLLDNRLGKVGFQGTFWKCARIGERKSPYVAVSCLFMAFSILFWS